GRVIRPNGLYHLGWGNPFAVAMEVSDWTDKGYQIRQIYADAEIIYNDDQYWEFADTDGNVCLGANPREFNHTLSTVVNGLIQREFQILGIWENEMGDTDASPGSWEHLKVVFPHQDGVTIFRDKVISVRGFDLPLIPH